MAVGESAGSIYVMIDGDVSPLMAKYAQAEAMSRAAGQRIATSLGSGLSSATGLVDQFGRAVSSGIEKPMTQAAPAVQRVKREVANLGGASEHSVTQIQAVGGAIRTGFGEQSIRAVERFVAMIPGVGTALQAIFPLIGGLALVEMLDRVFQKSEALTAAEKELETQTENTDRAFLNMAQSIDRINAQRLGKEFGPAAAAAGEADAAKAKLGDLRNELQKAKDDMGALATEAQGKVLLRPTGGSVIEEEYAPKFAAQGEKIKQLIAQIAVAEKELGEKQFEAGQAGASQSGELAAIRLANSEKALTQETAMARAVSQSQITATRAAADQRIASLDSEYARVVQTGAAEVAEAQAKEKAITDILAAELPKRLALIRSEAAADAQGKPQSEQEKIFATAAGKEIDVKGSAATEAFTAGQATAAAQNKATLSLIELNARLATELRDNVTRGWDELAKSAERASKEQQSAIDKDIAGLLREGEEASRAAEGRAHIAEEVGKGQGEIATARVKAQYEEQISHSIQQQVAYEQMLASIEDATYTKELTALAAKLKAAQALEDETEKAKQLLDIEAQIAALSGKAQAAGVSAQGQIDNLQQNPFQKLGEQFKSQGIGDVQAQMAKNIASGVDGVAAALARATVQGKNFGQALAQAGKQMATSLLTTVIEAGLKRVLSGLISLVPAFSAVSGAQAAAAVKANATAKASVLTAAGEAAAWAFESVMAALPFPVNVSVAPGVAASSFAQTTAFGAFADGTDSAPGGMALVGEKGPEIMHVPKGAQIIPNHKIGKYADGTPNFSRATSRSSSMSIGELHVHAHGVSNPDAFARQAVAAIPHELKRQSSTFSPYSS